MEWAEYGAGPTAPAVEVELPPVMAATIVAVAIALRRRYRRGSREPPVRRRTTLTCAEPRVAVVEPEPYGRRRPAVVLVRDDGCVASRVMAMSLPFLARLELLT